MPTFEDLVKLMEKLRSPDGCPWDREQTYATLAPMLLEEAYEAFEAVEEAREGRPEELRDELGDLLFQIVFYAQVARERRDFTIEDVTDSVHSKMVRRHPHVFGQAQEENAQVFAKLEEEIGELRAAMQIHAASLEASDHTRVREEIGDVLFAVTNI